MKRLFRRFPQCLLGLVLMSSVAWAELHPATITRKVVLTGNQQVKVRAADLPVSAFNFDSPDAWLWIEGMPPSQVIRQHLERFLVYYEQSVIGGNLRIEPYGDGSVVIPQGAAYQALQLYGTKGMSGMPVGVKCHAVQDPQKFPQLANGVQSFRLKRGYMATLATQSDGTGISRNFVAQDDDIEMRTLPEDLAGAVRYVRVFPWRWTGKKGIAGDITKSLNLAWYYNWNINQQSSEDMEYVPIKQKQHWPGLDQDWKSLGSLHLLGFNEPDRPDQANMTVDQAIQAWPGLMKTGLRLGSPAVSDGGLGWLYEFIDKADAKKLRVDFVAVHYYRAVADPGDGRAAAAQLEAFLEGIHKRTKRPIWITEWNNGANWTKERDPSEKEQARAIEKMIEMLDKLPYVERYAPYNWVEDCRMLERKDGSLTPAGEVYRAQPKVISYKSVR